MQAGLLTSQFQTLEIPRSDETDVITLAITQPVDDLVRQVLSAGNYTGVVLDLRHNPGGLLPEGIGLLDTFLREAASEPAGPLDPSRL
jgi:C-terminal processing protease CtpA/Prc